VWEAAGGGGGQKFIKIIINNINKTIFFEFLKVFILLIWG
jgi:hypothetical protein